MLFPQGVCYQIPPFQRNYQWDIPQIHRLMRDVRDSTFEVPEHWIGITLVGNSRSKCENSTTLGHHCFDILDGQQRFITLRLWCTALIDEYHRQTSSVPVVELVTNPKAEFRRESFMNIKVHALDAENWDVVVRNKAINSKIFDNSDSNSISRAYLYFRYALLVGIDSLTEDELMVPKNKKDGTSSIFNHWLELKEIKPISPPDILEILRKTVERLTISVLEHDQNKDEPIETIFETLNSARVELGQFDLFRNYLLIQSSQQQLSLYSASLQSSEQQIQKAKLNIRKAPLDDFLYDFLISQGIFDGTLKRDGTAREFKKFWESSHLDVKSYLDEVLTPSMSAWLIAKSGFEIKLKNINKSTEIARTLSRIESLSRGPFTPITTRIIYEWMKTPEPRSEVELRNKLKLVEVFVARALLAGVPFSPFRREMMQACKSIFVDKSISLEVWVKSKSQTDARIRQVMTQSIAKKVNGKMTHPEPADWILSSDFYERAEPKQIRAIFDGIIEFQNGNMVKPVVTPPSKKVMASEEISIEHLFPQSSGLWLEDLESWNTKLVYMENRLHAIGNLTVIPKKVNSSLSNKKLSEKVKGFKAGKVPLLKDATSFMSAPKWTTEEIDSRTIELTDLCLKIWSVPQ